MKFKDQGKYVQISNKNGEFINLGFFFYHHVKKVVGEHLTETIDFRFAEGNAPTATAIYDKTINIDTDSFMNLISRSSSIKRNEKYLEIANKLIKI